MSAENLARAVLMAADIRDNSNGFHRMQFKVEGGRNRMSEVTVLISQDAHRKLAGQLAKARVHQFDKSALLKSWARWEIQSRLREYGVLPATITITASDLDDFGAYAMDFSQTLKAS